VEVVSEDHSKILQAIDDVSQ
jgi:hypothetical protein